MLLCPVLKLWSCDDRKTRKKLMVNGELAGGDLEASWEGIEQNYAEQRRMLQIKDLREKQDMILHRRK